MIKRLLLCLMAAVCALSLTGCYTPLDTAFSPVATLPPATSRHLPPLGDEGMSYDSSEAMYLPSLDGQRLLAQYAPVALSHSQHSAESIVRALLSYPSNALVEELGAGVGLALYGPDPVEISGGVCTVNLSSSAMQLEHNVFHKVCMALAATLCEMPDIHYVNVLVADQAVGMDITGNLPMGSITAHPGDELPLLWEQLEARRAPVGTSPSAMPLTGTATLYFPLKGGEGVIAEPRNLTFPGQSADQLALGLLSALSAGPRYLKDTCDMPDIAQMMSANPLVADLEDGGRMLNLYFRQDLAQALSSTGVDPACYMASAVATLTTFIPAISSVRVYVGEKTIASLTHPTHGTMNFSGGFMRRADFQSYFMGQSTVFFSRGQQLAAVTRAMPDDDVLSPRALLAALMAGPTQAELDHGIEPSLPEELTADDVLGLSLEGDTLLVNLSSRFAQTVRQQAASWEQVVCYGMVNTLCRATGAARVRFFFDGKILEELGSSLYWGGEFLYNPGLIDQTVG